MEQLEHGATLQGGKYIIERVLGQGGFGITYLAKNVLVGKDVAIKEFFPKEFCNRENAPNLTIRTVYNAEIVSKLKARFIKEAQNIAKLDHPNIIKIYDTFEENNTAYYVMDYIEGENLNDMVKRNGALSEAKAVDYITKIGNALGYIHSRHMTHFDVKPANIMIRRKDDAPILIDFGLSKQYDIHGDATSTIMQGVSNGYSPIELYCADKLSSFSPQTDIYSLCATMYYLVTGAIPPNAGDLIDNPALLKFPYNISKSICDHIVNTMTVSRSQRINSVQTFINLLSSHHNSDNTIIISDITSTKQSNFNNEANHEAKTGQIGKIILILGFIVLFVGVGVWAYFYYELSIFLNSPDSTIQPMPKRPM